MTTSLAALTLRCGRCNHEWLRRTASEPVACPGCKSRYWNKERVYETPRTREEGIKVGAAAQRARQGKTRKH